ASGPSSVIGRPATFGASQSASEPCAIVHMMPKPVASSGFQGSRPIRPGRMYSRHSANSAQRGSASVAEAGSRTGFMQAGCVLWFSAIVPQDVCAQYTIGGRHAGWAVGNGESQGKKWNGKAGQTERKNRGNQSGR